jgi:hypothetical protein
MEDQKDNTTKQYVVLEHLTGVDKGYRFYTNNSGEMDHTISHDEHGMEIVAYKVVGYVDTDQQAQDLIHEAHSFEEGLLHHISQYPPELLAMMMKDTFYDDDENPNENENPVK